MNAAMPDPYDRYDPEEALNFVLKSFPPEISVRIQRVRAKLRLDAQHSVFVVLAICTQMLQQMERAQDAFAAPIDALREDLFALERQVEQYGAGRTDALQAEAAIVAEASKEAASAITRASTTISNSQDLLKKAAAEIQAAKSAASQIDEQTKAALVAQIVDRVDRTLPERLTFSLEWPMAIFLGLGNALVFVAGIGANALWLHFGHR